MDRRARLGAALGTALGAALVLMGVAVCVYAWPEYQYAGRLQRERPKILMAAGAISVAGGALLLRSRGRRSD